MEKSERDTAKEAAREIAALEPNGYIAETDIDDIISRVVLEPEREKYKRLTQLKRYTVGPLGAFESELGPYVKVSDLAAALEEVNNG